MTTVVACTLVTALWDIWNQRLIQFSLRFWSSFHKCPDGALSALLLFIHQSYLSLWSMDYSTQASLSLTISQSLLKLMSIELMMPSNHPIVCHSLLLMSSIFPRIRVFSSHSALCIRWPKYWSFSIRISPSNEDSGLISFRIDWFDLAVQETLKSFLQHYNLKASVFSAQPSLWSNSHICIWLLQKP